jgi:hypothetical protein
MTNMLYFECKKGYINIHILPINKAFMCAMLDQIPQFPSFYSRL